jgi:hypothetical protein
MRVRSMTGFGAVMQKAAGCIWNIQLENGTSLNDLKIPSTYSGSDRCVYNNTNHLPYVGNDSLNDAVYRLLVGLDLDSDGQININFDVNSLQFDTATTGGVRSLWGPVRVKLILWM